MKRFLTIHVLIPALIVVFGALTFPAGSGSQAQIGRGFHISQPAWSPDGSRIALVIGNSVEIRDAVTNQRLHVLDGHTDFIPGLAWSPDSRMVATPISDQTVRIWDAMNGTLLHTLSGHDALVGTVVWSPDGTKVYSWGFDTRPNLFVWDAATGALLERHNSGDIVGAHFSPDGHRLALHTSLGMGVIDAQTFEVISGSPNVLCCTNQMRTMAWSPGSTMVVTGSINGLVTIWDANTAEIRNQFIANPHHQSDSRDVDNPALSWVRDVTFSPDGRSVLSVSGDGTIREWNATTGSLLHETQLPPLATARWSPYGARLLVVDLTTRDGARLSGEQAFDASDIAGDLSIIVPFATAERLEMLAEACNLPTRIQADQLTEFVTQVEALPENTIPPACAADLIAVAEAMQSR